MRPWEHRRSHAGRLLFAAIQKQSLINCLYGRLFQLADLTTRQSEKYFYIYTSISANPRRNIRHWPRKSFETIFSTCDNQTDQRLIVFGLKYALVTT